MGSLQDALLKAGLADDRLKDRPKERPAAARKSRAARPAGKQSVHKAAGKTPRSKVTPSRAESDLARAYKAREQAEVAEKERVKRERLAAQEARRQRNLKLDEILSGNTLNRKEAEHPRYFEHLGRIRRVLCLPEQRQQLNDGQMGLVSLRGSYLLVSLETMEAFRAVAPDLVPDLTPKEPEDDGSDYPPVPDDLIW